MDGSCALSLAQEMMFYLGAHPQCDNVCAPALASHSACVTPGCLCHEFPEQGGTPKNPPKAHVCPEPSRLGTETNPCSLQQVIICLLRLLALACAVMICMWPRLSALPVPVQLKQGLAVAVTRLASSFSRGGCSLSRLRNSLRARGDAGRGVGLSW